jgi:organic hydroperoxide reductase OsmC/OhrA
LSCDLRDREGTVIAVMSGMAHLFLSRLDWTGGASGGTRDLATLDRDLDVTVDGITLPMSAAPAFGGDPLRVNPEQLYVAALSACHALTFLFLAARSHILVTGYTDDAIGELATVEGKMRMSTVTLRPQITLDPSASAERARTLVDAAHRQCFIGNSVSATVSVEPTITFGGPPSRERVDPPATSSPATAN